MQHWMKKLKLLWRIGRLSFFYKSKFPCVVIDSQLNLNSHAEDIVKRITKILVGSIVKEKKYFEFEDNKNIDIILNISIFKLVL